MSQPPRGGRLVAWAGFVFGSVMSIAANVLYTWLPHPPEGAPEGWMPPVGWAPSLASQIGAAVWPVALLISVEVLSRVQWPDRWTWKLARYGGAGVVALGSAVISYGHLNGVLTAWGYDWLGAAVGPLVLDGLMVVSGFALLAKGDTGGAPDGASEPEQVGQPEQVQPAGDEPADDLAAVRRLVAAGAGRAKVARELNTTPARARRLIEQVRTNGAVVR